MGGTSTRELQTSLLVLEETPTPNNHVIIYQSGTEKKGTWQKALVIFWNDSWQMGLFDENVDFPATRPLSIKEITMQFQAAETHWGPLIRYSTKDVKQYAGNYGVQNYI